MVEADVVALHSHVPTPKRIHDPWYRGWVRERKIILSLLKDKGNSGKNNLPLSGASGAEDGKSGSEYVSYLSIPDKFNMKTSSTLLIALLSLGLGISACNSTKPLTPNNVGEEAVDMGYGTQKRKNVTSSVSDVKTDNPNISLADYLRRIPGLSVRGGGNTASVSIRGVSSFVGSQEPLFVLDGTPIGQSFSDVASFINVNDVEKVTVLKDASASSIYGTRGTNGVILIKTRK
jgi:TonB-dependent SusC/RagA subfamily outer membrane receptor